jgi:4-hydroxythreonine-4-phosphate dehydrogenase
MGEPAGIGGDIALLAWARRSQGVPPFVLIDDPARLVALATRLGLEVPIRPVAEVAEAAALFDHALPVLPQPLAVAVEPGRPDPRNVAAVTQSIRRAVDLARDGQVQGLVTNPIAKHVMHAGGFGFPGHTEFLASLVGEAGYREVMMLACPGLRVVPVTIHVGLAQAIRELRTDDIVEIGAITARALTRDFGIDGPRLAVAALNPHAGEAGAMGTEEATVITPALQRLRAMGIDAFGPLPADTLFHVKARATYDAVLCMYHDQALIPLKTVDFDQGVNITLGLPFVRTSPDHGTAFDLAGSGRANPQSLMAALAVARTIAGHRGRAP